MLEERKKLYEAIGYSENAETAIYPKEVYMCVCIYMYVYVYTHVYMVYIL